MKHTLFLALALFFAPLLGGCQAFGIGEPDPTWVEYEMSAASENVLWQVVCRSLESRRYPLGAGLDPDRLIAQTGWLRSLAPFKGRGYQVRAIVEIEPREGDLFFIRIRVQRQNNEALVNPADPRYAEWVWVPDDETEAKILMRHIRTYLDTDIELGDSIQ